MIEKNRAANEKNKKGFKYDRIIIIDISVDRSLDCWIVRIILAVRIN